MACASRNGMPRCTSHSARSVAAEYGRVGGGLHAGGVEGRRRQQTAQRLEGAVDLVEGVEQRLLVLLEVAVVGEREALQRGQEAGEVADDTAGLAAGELGDVGVLLLRHHRRPRRPGVVEAHEPELVGRPQAHLLADAREVDGEQRDVEERLGDEVAVADGVEAVLEGGVEAEVVRRRRGVERQRRTGEGAGAERRDVEAAPGVEQAVDVAPERPAVRQQVVGQQHRLRPLQVRVARQVGGARVLGPGEEHALQLRHLAGDRGELALAEEAERGGHLVVAAAAGVELRPRLARRAR